ncbi:MAG: hypothetical protein K0R71_2240 [Bacillales bacterium]|jgi:uncharacterized membrane protein|nr:hypothetical protein [Bacillales bacterium]
MDSNSVLRGRARQSLNGNWGTAILITIIFGVINGLIAQFGEDDTKVEILITSFVITPIISALIASLSYGVDWAYLNLVRNKEFKMGTILEPLKIVFLKSIFVEVLKWLLTTIGLILFIVPGFIVGAALSQTSYILKDQPHLSTLETLKYSKNMMYGYKWKYTTLMFSFIGWSFLCILTLGIGFLWLSPYISASTAEFYNNLSESYHSKNGILLSDLNNKTYDYDQVKNDLV